MMGSNSSEYLAASTPELQERMKQTTEHQEQQLDALHSGVKRLKHAAQATNDEVISQNAMLEHISVQVDDTKKDVVQQTEAARKVAKAQNKLCGYYVTIGLLAAALIVVIAI